MRNFEQALQEHKERVLAEGYTEDQILGIFLYGSQNYNCALEDSDVDTKCIIVPTIEEALFDKIRVKELVLDNSEHCEVMNIVHLIDNLKKQNINFVEILFTEYKWVNPKYEFLWKMFFANQKVREDIAHYDMNKCVRSICGQAIHTLKQSPRNGKKCGNARRLQHFLTYYLKGEEYENCLRPNSSVTNEILAMKSKKELTTDVCANALIEWFEAIKTLHVDKPVDKEIEKYMQLGATNLVQKREKIMKGAV